MSPFGNDIWILVELDNDVDLDENVGNLDAKAYTDDSGEKK